MRRAISPIRWMAAFMWVPFIAACDIYYFPDTADLRTLTEPDLIAPGIYDAEDVVAVIRPAQDTANEIWLFDEDEIVYQSQINFVPAGDRILMVASSLTLHKAAETQSFDGDILFVLTPNNLGFDMYDPIDDAMDDEDTFALASECENDPEGTGSLTDLGMVPLCLNSGVSGEDISAWFSTADLGDTPQASFVRMSPAE